MFFRLDNSWSTIQTLHPSKKSVYVHLYMQIMVWSEFGAPQTFFGIHVWRINHILSSMAHHCIWCCSYKVQWTTHKRYFSKEIWSNTYSPSKTALENTLFYKIISICQILDFKIISSILISFIHMKFFATELKIDVIT